MIDSTREWIGTTAFRNEVGRIVIGLLFLLGQGVFEFT